MPKAVKVKRVRPAEVRRQAILDAALDEFAASGFAAARLEDIAKRAGVAKGTIYLYFKDKEALFQQLVSSSLVPIVSTLAVSSGEQSVRAILEMFAKTVIEQVLRTKRAQILRLIIAEGNRFPAIAEFYFREVVQRGMTGMSMLLAAGVARGEISATSLPKFPQIVAAPLLAAVIWQSLFEPHSPLDVEDMFKTHIDLICGPRRPI
ncbi:MAG: TetR/AcrR family transcriptional regulator [Pseudomonadota bacterium]|jgi:AcrR family transcriptional regulator